MKSDASFRSLRYSGDILGVDLGSHTIKVIQLRVSGQRVLVLDYAQKEVWPLLAELKSEGDVKAALAGALKELLKSRKFGTTRAAVALPGNYSLVKFLAVPKDHPRDSRTGAPEQAKSLSPFEPRDTALEVRPLEGRANQAQAEFMVVIAQKKAINDTLGIIRKAGLRPSVVINDALALESSYDFSNDKSAPAPALLVNIGAATTTVAVVENGLLKAVRTFNIAGDVFTRAIKREFGLETAEAEGLKKEYGLFGHRMAASGRAATGSNEAYRIYNETAMRVAKALEPAVKDLALSVQQTADAFLERRPEAAEPIGKVVLAGGGADMKGLVDVIGAQTRLPVEIMRPLKKALIKQPADFDKASASLSIAFGLGLSSVLRRSADKPRLNLLPSEAKRAAAIRNAARVLLILGIIVCAAILGKHLVEVQQRRVALQEIETERKLKEAASQKKKVNAPSKPGAKPKPAESPNARFGRLKVSGLFGGMVMLSGSRGGYVAKEGLLFDDDGRPVPGATSHVGKDSVVLTVRGERFVIALPK